MNSKQFRKELMKIMPGYKWTVHRNASKDQKYISASGIQFSGFTRLSTLQVTRREEFFFRIEYEVKSSGYGTRAPWLGENTDSTLARALRGLQNHYDEMAKNYRRHYADLEVGRGKP